MTRARLLKQYGSLANIAAATDDELAAAGLDAKTVSEMRTVLAKSTPLHR
jgi:excinuclease UvrABC nuclease subunit